MPYPQFIVSTGFNVMGHVPLGRRFRKSLFLGVGIEYDYLTLEKHTAGNLRFRGEMGFRIYMEKTVIDIFAAGLYSRSISKFNATDSPTYLELDCSSVMIGMNFYFLLNR